MTSYDIWSENDLGHLPYVGSGVVRIEYKHSYLNSQLTCWVKVLCLIRTMCHLTVCSHPAVSYRQTSTVDLKRWRNLASPYSCNGFLRGKTTHSLSSNSSS